MKLFTLIELKGQPTFLSVSEASGAMSYKEVYEKHDYISYEQINLCFAYQAKQQFDSYSIKIKMLDELEQISEIKIEPITNTADSGIIKIGWRENNKTDAQNNINKIVQDIRQCLERFSI